MTNKNLFDRYVLTLRKSPIDEKTEHTDRAALQTLLQAVADDGAVGVSVHHEPKRVADKGAPDFKISKGGLILGYVENKAIGENLDKVLKSGQIARYKTLSQNIILTDYLHFIWINKDGIQRETLCHATDLENPKFRLKEDRVEAVSKLLQAFFSTAPEGIGRAQQLALALATRSKLLHDYLGEELVRQEREHKEGRLYGLFQIFRDQIFHELTLNEFADAFAQMLAYGLFLARLNSDSSPITLHNAREYVPGSFRLIRELVDFLTELEKAEYRDVRWVVEEVLSIVNALDLPAIHEDLSFRKRKAINRKVRASDEAEHRLFERDPFIYFYEDYLKAYDAATRKSRGVYYTPPPIVNFIVRAVDDILKESFKIPDGLADNKRVTVLDFACGTGTFLLEAFQRIFDNIGGPDNGRADLIVRDHLLKNLFGFEYLIAPYTIAHLKGNAAELHRDFNVAKKAGWDICKGWQALADSGRPTASYVRSIVYTPFDSRYIFYEDALVWRTVRRIMDHIDDRNVVLLSSRITKDDPSALVVSAAYRHKSATRYDISYGFPLFLNEGATENISSGFRSFLDSRYEHHYTPEEILGYIYAVLHTPTYLTRYAEFLRIDFPRVPFPESADDFEKLSKLGWALVQAHLLRELPRRGLAAYHGKGDHTVEAVRYSPEEQAVAINKTQFFKPMPQAVWEFHIGGYQVLDKYLKSRKGRELSLDEINHVSAVADSLSFTIEQMAKIDEAYRGAFPDRG